MVRRAATRLVFVLALAIGIALAPPAGAGVGPGVAAAECKHKRNHPKKLTKKHGKRAIVCLINKRRSKRGLRQLEREKGLRSAAQRHSRRMRKTGCFAHQCPGEPSLSGRVSRTGYLPCGCNWALGENIATGRDRRGSPLGTVQRWMDSPGHRRNLLDPRFRHVGVGFAHGGPGDGSRRAATFTITFGTKR